MEEREIIENNRLIAEFMGDSWHISEHDDYMNFGNYHRKWENLMPVVEKIEEITDRDYDFIQIEGDHCTAQIDPNELPVKFYGHNDNKISATYDAAIAFIKWHNQSK